MYKYNKNTLLSVCLTDLPCNPEGFTAVIRLADEVRKRFCFWEFVLVVNSDEADAYLPLLKGIDNLRLIKVRIGTQHYRKTVIAASETIGDLVAVVSAEELPFVDIIKMTEEASKTGSLIIGQRKSTFLAEKLVNTPLFALGHSAGFKCQLTNMQTMVFPRTILNRLLAHPDSELALRFPPYDSNIDVRFVAANGVIPKLYFSQDFGRRIALVDKLLINLAPRLLLYVSLLSAFVSGIAFLFFFYAIGAWLLLPSVEPGWLTLSLMLSITGCLLGGSIFGLSIGLQHLLSRVEQGRFDDVVDEINRVDVFNQVAQDLNVEVEISEPEHN